MNAAPTAGPASRLLPRSTGLLLQFLHGDPALPDPADLAGLRAADWDALTDEAIDCRIAFQVCERLKADPRRLASAPGACIGRLEDVVRGTLLRNLRQQGHLREMLTALQAADIPVLLVKGLWLAETVYRDHRARATGDIDLLFRPHDMTRLTQLARELGFDVPPGARSVCELAPSANEFPLRHPGKKSFFDVHWSLTRPPLEAAVDEEKFWQRSETATLGGRLCRGLSLEDQLLYVCFHAVEHHRFLYVGPRALVDVALLVSRPPRPLDWDAIATRARELRWQRGLWLMLDLAREYLGVMPPPAILDALRPPAPPDAQTRRAFIAALFLDQLHAVSLPANVVRALDERSGRRRVALLLRRLFPTRESVATYFNRPADAPDIYWLYLKRMLMLGSAHLPKIGKLLYGDAASQHELERVRLINRWFDG